MKIHKINTIVVGSGASALNATDWLGEDVAIITEGFKKGTSRNTGSDKQTYYKLSISGESEDSVYKMAETLFSGSGVDGDIALCEATGSVQSFMKLANLKIPFPTNEYGEFVGYKTDHDPYTRATSAGPLTSKYMVEGLEKEVFRKNIQIFDELTVFKVFTESNSVKALLCLNNKENSFELFYTNNVIWCTGGPAICYYYSVFPGSQTGMSGALLEIGASGKNLAEWQYGLASVKFRWNVSGTYQQVIPRYISVDKDGNEYEFLADTPNVFDKIFLKGYEWPFDTRKVNGSSMIDILVYDEFIKGRRVYMDFKTNPKGLDFSKLSKESYEYLEKSDVLFGTPIERLAKMNPLAIKIYKDHNIDLYTENLEVMVCAQHHNGGIDVDTDWQTNINGLYACGEVAGTFGVYRPGGSALNATQVGSMRSAQHILRKEKTEIVQSEEIENQANLFIEKIKNVSLNGTSISKYLSKRQKQMSSIGAHIRDISKMQEFLDESYAELDNFFEKIEIKSENEYLLLLKAYDMLLTQCAVLDSMIKTGKTFGSRGSALISDEKSPKSSENLKIITEFSNNRFESHTKAINPIPKPDNWFENVWAEYRKQNNIL